SAGFIGLARPLLTMSLIRRGISGEFSGDGRTRAVQIPRTSAHGLLRGMAQLLAKDSSFAFPSEPQDASMLEDTLTFGWAGRPESGGMPWELSRANGSAPKIYALISHSFDEIAGLVDRLHQ